MGYDANENGGYANAGSGGGGGTGNVTTSGLTVGAIPIATSGVDIETSKLTYDSGNSQFQTVSDGFVMFSTAGTSPVAEFYPNPTLGNNLAKIGDAAKVGNSTLFTVDDSERTISLASYDTLITDESGANVLADISLSPEPFAEIGDVSGNFNGTLFILQDSNQIISFIFGSQLTMGDVINNNEIAQFQTHSSNFLVKIGDVNSVFNSNLFTVDDQLGTMTSAVTNEFVINDTNGNQLARFATSNSAFSGILITLGDVSDVSNGTTMTINDNLSCTYFENIVNVQAFGTRVNTITTSTYTTSFNDCVLFIDLATIGGTCTININNAGFPFPMQIGTQLTFRIITTHPGASVILHAASGSNIDGETTFIMNPGVVTSPRYLTLSYDGTNFWIISSGTII